MAITKIQIQNRAETGKNFVDKMRVEDMIPGVVYSRGGETIHITIKQTDFIKAYRVAGSASLLELELEGDKVPAIIKEIQKHPFRNEILHVDFQKINMDEKIRMTIPIILINRDSINVDEAVLMQLIDEVDIECLPGNIPSSIEVDVQDMDLETPIMIEDLDIAKDDDITILSELDQVICTLTIPAIEEEPEDELDDVELDEDGEPIESEESDDEEETEE